MQHYIYLAAIALLGIGLIALVAKCAPSLRMESAHRTRTELGLLALACAFALVAIYFNFYTETFVFAYGTGDFGTDTYEQYIPYYTNLIDNIRNGTFSLWNFEFGLGTSLSATQSWTLDPFNLFLIPFVLVAGESHLSLGLVLAQSLKIALSVFLFDHLLTRYCAQPLSRILGSLLFGFAGFMVMYGQHYWLGSVYPALTASVLCFELFLERNTLGRFVLTTICTAWLLAWSPYIAFMILLFDAFYLLLRIACVKGPIGFAGYLKQVGRMCLPVLCGVLLAGAGLIPYVLFLAGETARTSAETSLLERIGAGLTGFISPSDFLLTLSRMLGSGLVNNGGAGWGLIAESGSALSFDPYEFILLGFSGGIFILLSQFFHWVATEADRRERVLAIIAIALVVLFCVNCFLPLLFTGLVKVQYRCSFILNVPIIIAAAIGWEKRIAAERIAWGPLWAAAALTLVVLAWSFANAITHRYACAFFIVALAAACIVFALMKSRKLGVNIALALIVVCFFSTSIVDAFSYTNLRILLNSQDFPNATDESRDQDTLDALAYLEETDTTFYRVDKTYAEWTPHNDSLIQHFNGASAYDSSPDANIAEFREQLWDSSVVGGVAWSSSFKEDPDEAAIADLIGLKYVLSKDELSYNWLEEIARFGEVIVYRNTADASGASIRTQAVSESQANALASAADRRALLAESVIVPDEVAEELAGSLGADSSAAGEGAAEGQTAQATLYEDASDYLHGEISCTADSVVCLAIPHTSTWEITVDRQTVDTFRANYGFIGIQVSAGTHTIEAHYKLGGLDTGLAVSGIGILVFAASCLAIAHSTRKERRAMAQ